MFLVTELVFINGKISGFTINKYQLCNGKISGTTCK